MLNDRLGDCTCAGLGHAVQVWTNDAQSAMVTPTDADVLEAYEVQGYNPKDPSTDRGANEQSVLSWAANVGMLLPDGSRSKLSAFIEVDPRNMTDVCEAIMECGLVYIGFSVPGDIPEAPGSTWDNCAGPIVGGHCVILPGFNASAFDVISWGERYIMTRAFWAKYVDECYALASPLWIGATGRTPWGLDEATLEAIMQAIKS